MPVAKVSDTNIYYEDQGQGEALVLITGIGGDSTQWFRQVPAFSSEYRVIAIDNRGAGRSDKPDMPYTMEMMAADIAGVLDGINVDTAHVFGISMDGMIAQRFALDYPKRVQTLILGATTCGGLHWTKGTLDAAFKAWMASDHLRNLTPKEIFLEGLTFGYSQTFIDNNPAIMEQYYKATIDYPAPPHGFARQQQAIDGHDTYDRLPEIKVPALVIAGDSDRLISVENSRLLASMIPNAELVLLKNAGHGFFVEVAEEVNKIVLSFLRKYNRSR
jgi:pimeloyl-ACP methyl ester carboxylesterase